MAETAGWPRTGFVFLDEPRSRGAVLAMAHRGGAPGGGSEGAPLKWENTMRAFSSAVALGYRYLETDARTTRDGVLLAFHDDRLDRVTDRRGKLSDLTYAEVSRARVGGEEPIPRLAELFDAFPQARFNIDLKTPLAVEPMARLVEQQGLWDRVCIGSFSARTLRRFRSRLGASADRVVTTCGIAATLRTKYLGGYLTSSLTSASAARQRADPGQVFQVPPRFRDRLPVLDAAFVRHAHAGGRQVHAWTVNDRDQMERLLDLGVDGLITDRTDVLKDVLVARGLWEGTG